MWTSPDGKHQNQTDYILFSWRWRSSVQSSKTRSGADFGSDHQLPFAELRLKSKKVGKTTRLFRYDLNQIRHDYTVEVTNRFKGLDLVDRVHEEWWMEVHNLYRRRWLKPSQRKRNARSQSGYLRRLYKEKKVLWEKKRSKRHRE